MNNTMKRLFLLLAVLCVSLSSFSDETTTESRDFHDGVTRSVINQWGSDHTEGMIEEAITEDEFNPDAVSYLLNALYFKGTWTNKFDKNYTQDEPFAGGQTVPMMQQWERFQYTENNLYQAVCLPYGRHTG